MILGLGGQQVIVGSMSIGALVAFQALQRFEAARLDRTTAIVRGSADNTRRFHNPALGDPAGAADYIEREFAAEKIQQRYDWLYEYDALTVAL